MNLFYKIEIANPEDAEGIYLVQKETWIVTYVNEEAGISEELIKKRFNNPEASILKIRNRIETNELPQFIVRNEKGRVVAFNAPRYEIIEGSDESKQRLGGLYVLDEYQGKGIGKMLLLNNIEFWQSKSNLPIFLHVVEYNTKSINFYLHFGFKFTGLNPPFKLDEDHIIPGIEMVYNF